MHVFYEVKKWAATAVQHANEIGQRARYMMDVLPGLEPHGVVLRGAVPPDEIARELLPSDFMVYPCDTLQFTEGFSCSTMEACAAGTVPIITDADALGELYKDSGAIVVPRHHTGVWVERFRDTVIECLLAKNDPEQARAVEERRKQCRQFAAGYDYSVVGKQFHEMLQAGMAEKSGRDALSAARRGDPSQ